ncbi:MAG: 16S rRNA (cytidine(1402)-2'-O)-methyltransferase [Deltaproteobacteria bacterium]|nr:16S rRNA (cytidine(1402)-2'-O)-methyltransferase [Deltaproteobacteria bacterium]
MPLKRPPESGEKKKPGTLFVVATPIGNLSDVTLRALEVLKTVQFIAAEDTRHTRKLLTHHQIRKRLLSYHAHNAGQRGPVLMGKLLAGEDLALVTDAGTPSVSDPGEVLIREALHRGVPVVVIPGPSAVVTALVASGLPSCPFAFLGFPPSRGSARGRFLEAFATLPMTLVLYESPKRLARTLEELLQVWGDRPVAVARELTKLHEEVYRGTLSQAVQRFSAEVRGEVTLVVGGFVPRADTRRNDQDWLEDLESLLREKEIRLREAVEIVAARHGLPRRQVYGEALKRKESRE